jgi:hypothetical protein
MVMMSACISIGEVRMILSPKGRLVHLHSLEYTCSALDCTGWTQLTLHTAVRILASYDDTASANVAHGAQSCSCWWAPNFDGAIGNVTSNIWEIGTCWL